MNTQTLTAEQPTVLKKKRGPAPKFDRLVDTHVHMPPDLLEWAKRQPEGFAGLMRQLLAHERARREESPARAPALARD